MKVKKLKIMSWNVRGLGDSSKCNVVRNSIRQARCDVCCLQETKMNTTDFQFYSLVFPSYFERNVVGISAIGTAGGCVIGWKR